MVIVDMDYATSDPEAYFSAVYEQFYGRVRAYAARRAGADAADEIAAETFALAWRRLEQIPSEPLPWLYGVARNIFARHRSAHARELNTQVALRFERPAIDEHGESWPELWDAWEELKSGDREVLALVAWEELTVRDAAAALGCAPAVFSVRLHRARRRLERLLQHRAQPAAPVSHLSEAR